MSKQDLSFLPFFLREPVYVVPETTPPSLPEERTLPALPHRGQGRQGIVLLVRETDHAMLAPDDQAFLEKILQAVSLTLEDAVVVNTAGWEEHLQNGFSTDELLAGFSGQTYLVLGPVPGEWSQSNYFEKYRVIRGENAQHLLQADTLAEIASDTDKKVRLWKCLQQLFVKP